jgi:stress response protein SCP2
MSVSLEKGAKVDLNKAAIDAGATAPLTKVMAGAGWDPKSDGASIDLDLIGIKLGADGKTIADANGNGTNYDEAVNFFQNLTTQGGVHSGDNLTGEGDGDDETITYDLNAVEPEVQEIVVLVASYSGTDFSEVANVKVRMVNTDDNQELACYTNTELGNGRAVEVGRVKREGNGWSFQAVGNVLSAVSGQAGGQLIKSVLENYGVTGL